MSKPSHESEAQTWSSNSCFNEIHLHECPNVASKGVYSPPHCSFIWWLMSWEHWDCEASTLFLSRVIVQECGNNCNQTWHEKLSGDALETESGEEQHVKSRESCGCLQAACSEKQQFWVFHWSTHSFTQGWRPLGFSRNMHWKFITLLLLFSFYEQKVQRYNLRPILQIYRRTSREDQRRLPRGGRQEVIWGGAHKHAALWEQDRVCLTPSAPQQSSQTEKKRQKLQLLLVSKTYRHAVSFNVI